MSNENRNSIDNWKSNLDELSSLPGEEIFNKSVSWGNLHQRLGGKKSNKKSIWYWMAAACFLLALMLPFINLNKGRHQVIQSEVAGKRPGNIKASPPVIKEDVAKIINPSSAKKSETVTIVNENKIRKSVISGEVNKSIHVTDTVRGMAEELQNLNTISPVENSSNIASIRPEKKKLRVIHINELGDSFDQPQDMSHGREVHSFQFKFGDQVVYTNSSTSHNKEGVTLIKAKPSPN